MTDTEKAHKLIDILGEENASLLLRLMRGTDAVLPLLIRQAEYAEAVSNEVTSLLNRKALLRPELRGYVGFVEYIVDAEKAKGGLLFQIENANGSLRVWYGDREYSHLFDAEETGELMVSVTGELPSHTSFFLLLLSVAQEQLFTQLKAYEDGVAVMLIKPSLKN